MSKLEVLVETLSAHQAEQLRPLGITKQRLCDYRKGRRRPSLAHAKAIALIQGANFSEIAEEMANEDATQEQLSFFRRAMGGASPVAGAVLFAVSLANSSNASALPSADIERGAGVRYVNYLDDLGVSVKRS